MSTLSARQKLTHFICVCSLAFTALMPLAVSSQTVKVPIGQQGHSQDIAKPALGMTMSAVKAQFGSPVTQSPARGEPPIIRWEYNGFVVYFESDVVIHSVTKHQRTD